jgi:hypothetical protein
MVEIPLGFILFRDVLFLLFGVGRLHAFAARHHEQEQGDPGDNANGYDLFHDCYLFSLLIKTGLSQKRYQPKLPLTGPLRFWYDFYKCVRSHPLYKVMDIIIFLKAIGNLLFAAILLLAVAFSSAFSVLTYMFRGSRPSVAGIKGLVRKKYTSR